MAITVDVPQSSLGVSAPSGLSTTVAFNTGATVSAGARIVICIFCWSDAQTLTSIAGGGLSWAIDRQRTTGGAPSAPRPSISSALAPSGLASGTTITGTFSSSVDSRSISGFSLLGVDTGDYIGNTGQVLHDTVSTWSTGNITCEDRSMLVGFVGSETTGGTSTPDDNELSDYNGPYAEPLSAGYQIASGAGAIAVSGTWTAGNKNAATVGVEYRAADEGPPWEPEVDSAKTMHSLTSGLVAR